MIAHFHIVQTLPSEHENKQAAAEDDEWRGREERREEEGNSLGGLKKEEKLLREEWREGEQDNERAEQTKIVWFGQSYQFGYIMNSVSTRYFRLGVAVA